MHSKRQRTIAYIAMSITVFVWGCGFVFSQQLIDANLKPSFINMIRFATGVVLIGAVFNKKLKFSKQLWLFGLIGGVLLFGAFNLQLTALEYTTPAYNGFFTASYILFVPIIVWIIFKKRPTIYVTIGIIVAIVGFFVLNFGGTIGKPIDEDAKTIMIGNFLTILCALLFAFQIIFSDYVLHNKKQDAMSFTFTQLTVALLFFIIYFFAFDFKGMDFGIVDWNSAILPLCFVSILGTAFAYPSQTNAQLHIAPSETSLLMSFEAVIGTILSIILGYDIFAWYIVVGGILVTVAIILVEVVPEVVARKKEKIIDNEENENIDVN